MKVFTLILSVLFLTISPLALASSIKANLSGEASEVQFPTNYDGHDTVNKTILASAQLTEVSRSESADVVNIYLRTSNVNSSQYLAVLHDADAVSLTFDFSRPVLHGHVTLVYTQAQIMGDDDQIRKADGLCVLSLDQSLDCTLNPTFNAFGLLENTNLNLTLK